MNYSTEIIINKPIEVVIKKMNSVDNMKHWQEGLVATEHISGIPSELGAKMKLHYNTRNRKMVITETITSKNLPKEIHATYALKGIRNMQENYFESTEEGFTKWTSKNDFQPTNFAMYAMLFLMPRAFKKQTLQYMTNFKNFVEHGTSVANA